MANFGLSFLTVLRWAERDRRGALDRQPRSGPNSGSTLKRAAEVALHPFRALIWSTVGFAALAASAAQPAPAPDLASNPAPVIAPLNPALPTLFIAGDSTAARGKGAHQQGWAVPFADYFDPAKVNVANRARGGRSSRTYFNEGLWARLLVDVKPGDVVLIQFGHNDGGPTNVKPARGSLPGIGEETETIQSITTHQPETVHTFGWYMRKFIADTQGKHATAIVLSPTVRNIWTDGKIERGPGSYPLWSESLARAAGIPFVDLSSAMADQFNALGAAKTAVIYEQDHTHFNARGADLHARAVLAGLKALSSSPVTGWLSAKGRAVPPARPYH